MNTKLLQRIDVYYRLAKKFAAAPEFVQLRDEKGSELWFGDEMSKSNGDRFFAILDRSNIDAIKKLEDEGLVYTDGNAETFYLQNDKTKETLKFIINSYNQRFPGLSGNGVYQHLYDDGTLDPDSGASTPNPVFILIHDLIHQVLQSDFTESLNNQRQRDDEGLYPSLIDELYEDIASSLSGFQPRVKNIGQGVFRYLENIFNSKWRNDVASEAKLRQKIEETFHQAKAELRGKVDGLVNREEISDQKVPAELKQLVDGILSRAKHKMLQEVPDIADDETHYANWVWNQFDLVGISEQYYSRIMESKVVNQTDSSALRAWMQDCLGAMKRLNNYFVNDLRDELYEEYPEDE